MQLPSQTDVRIRRALSRGHLVDLTTTGRRSGQPRRVELVFHAVDGRVIISGLPGRVRDWLLNIRSDPRVVLPPQGTDQGRSAGDCARDHRSRGASPAAGAGGAQLAPPEMVERMMTSSPLVEIVFDEDAGPVSS